MTSGTEATRGRNRLLPEGFAAPPIPARLQNPKPDWLVAYLFLAPAAAIFTAFIAYPLADGVATAFTNRIIARSGEFIGLSNFATLFADPYFQRSALNVCAPSTSSWRTWAPPSLAA